jgi:hypothetical protein
VLTPFPAATSLLLRARQELDHVLAEPVPRTVLTTMTVAGGALSSRDIASIVNDSAPAIRRILERGLSRVVEPRPGTPTRYTLAHDTLAVAVQEDLEPEEFAHTRTAIDSWALGYAAAGWPDDTPDYLTDGYPTLLLTEGAGRTLAALASPARRALLRRRTDGDLAALSELSNAAKLFEATPDCDLTLLTRVSLLREHIENDNSSKSSDASVYPLLLVRLGRTEEGVQFARAQQHVYAQADALLAIGEHLLDSRPVEARNLIHEAMAVPGRLPLEQMAHTVRAALALARHGEPGAADIARRAVIESGDERGWSLTTVADALAEIDPALTRHLMEEAIGHADAEDRPDFCGLLASAFTGLGDLDRFLQHVADLDRDDRKQALLTACDEHFAKGGRRNVPEALLTALNDEFTASEVVESAACQDEDRAHHLLALPASASPGLDLVDLSYTALAAHGLDPRQPGACDELLAHAATSARANGHLSLAVSLARDIADPGIRADHLAETAVALLDSDASQDASPLVREVEAALDETRNTPLPTVLAAFARAADTAGRTDLATSALELALNTVLQDGDDTDGKWGARAAAGAAARLGHLDLALRVAAAFEADEIDHANILLDAARAVEAHDDHRSADLDLLIAQVTEGIARSANPSVSDWPPYITHELISLHLRAGRAGPALDLARRLARTDLSGRTLEMRAHLLSDDIPSALSLIRETALTTPAGSPQDRARRQEQAAAMIVEMCDAGHRSLCRDVTAQLAAAAAAAPGVTLDGGLWAHPWLTAACRATGLTEDFTGLLDTLRHTALVTGRYYVTRTVSLEAVVRLRLWDRYHAEARRLGDVLAEGVLTDLVATMLDAGLLTESLPFIDDLKDNAARCLALAAAVTSPPSVDLVKRSLAHGFAEDVIAPLAALEPACLQEIAAQLGVIRRPPAEQVTLRAPTNS